MISMEPTDDKIDTWAVAEMMGHQTFAGRVSEHTIGGAALLRIDIPAVPEKTIPPAYVGDRGRVLRGQPPFTKYFALGALYALTPCTEEVARCVAEQARKYPVDLVAMPQVETLALTARDEEYDRENDGPGF
jgi:hypothetical protein